MKTTTTSKFFEELESLRGVRTFRQGINMALEDEHGRCPICSLAHFQNPDNQWKLSASRAMKAMGYDLSDTDTFYAIRDTTAAADSPIHSLRGKLKEALGMV